MAFLAMAEAPKLDIRPTIEIRERFERRIDRDLFRVKEDNKSDLLGRYRAGFDLSYGTWKGKLVYQVADDECWTPQKNFMTERRDVILAFAEHKLANGMLTVGRQKFSLSTARFFSELNWNWVSYSFDAVRWRTPRVEVFAGKVGVSAVPNQDYRYAAAVYRTGGGEAFVLYNHDTPTQLPSDRYTFDYVQRYKKGGLVASGEVAVQTGDDTTGPVHGLGFYGQATYATTKKLGLFVEGNVGNADLDTGFGAAHLRNGLLDVQGWRNALNFGVGLRYKAAENLGVNLDYHVLGLNDAKAPWYGSTGTIFKRPGGSFQDPTGKAGRDLGQEWDIEAKWDCRKTLSFGAGLGVFIPGHFARTLGADRNHTYGYLQTTYKF